MGEKKEMKENEVKRKGGRERRGKRRQNRMSAGQMDVEECWTFSRSECR